MRERRERPEHLVGPFEIADDIGLRVDDRGFVTHDAPPPHDGRDERFAAIVPGGEFVSADRGPLTTVSLQNVTRLQHSSRGAHRPDRRPVSPRTYPGRSHTLRRCREGSDSFTASGHRGPQPSASTLGHSSREFRWFPRSERGTANRSRSTVPNVPPPCLSPVP